MEFNELINKVIQLNNEGKTTKEIAEECKVEEYLVASLLVNTKGIYFK